MKWKYCWKEASRDLSLECLVSWKRFCVSWFSHKTITLEYLISLNKIEFSCMFFYSICRLVMMSSVIDERWSHQHAPSEMAPPTGCSQPVPECGWGPRQVIPVKTGDSSDRWLWLGVSPLLEWPTDLRDTYFQASNHSPVLLVTSPVQAPTQTHLSRTSELPVLLLLRKLQAF